MAACLNVLKAEIRALEAAFPRGHPRLQIVSASVDELTCKFVDGQGRKHVIHANITVGGVQSGEGGRKTGGGGRNRMKRKNPSPSWEMAQSPNCPSFQFNRIKILDLLRGCADARAPTAGRFARSFKVFFFTFPLHFFLLQETYPSTPPVWFSESEDSSVTSALTSLSESPSGGGGGGGGGDAGGGGGGGGLDNHLLHQVN